MRKSRRIVASVPRPNAVSSHHERTFDAESNRRPDENVYIETGLIAVP
jgi:hypothetical protein